MPLHFVADAAFDAVPGDTLTVTGSEAHHAVAVRRIRPGEQVTIGDGRGVWLTAECVTVQSRDAVSFRAQRRQSIPEQRPRLGLVQALAKSDRDELAIQAATELGADLIVPWQAARSVSQWRGDRAAKGQQRWSTIVREAAKQSHRAWIPEVAPLHSSAEVAALASDRRVLILDPTAATPLTSVQFDQHRDVLVVVGPEGGIETAELDVFTAAGAEPVRLGETVLRTSTAGPAALAVISAALGRW